MTHAKIKLAAALAGIVGLVAVASFLATMSPLEALFSPFRWLVTTRDVPERLRMSADLSKVDSSRLTDALRQVSVAQDLKPDGSQTEPGDPHYLATSLSDSHGNRLSVLKTSGEYYARVLQRESSTDAASGLAYAVRQALLPLGFKELP